MSKITITDPVGLRDAIAFAQEAGCLDQFGRDLCHLLRSLTMGMTSDNNVSAQINRDFAPHSFTFAVWRNEPMSRENLLLNGGFIYDGPGSPSDGSFPSLTVSLGRISGEGPVHSWKIHT